MELRGAFDEHWDASFRASEILKLNYAVQLLLRALIVSLSPEGSSKITFLPSSR